LCATDVNLEAISSGLTWEALGNPDVGYEVEVVAIDDVDVDVDEVDADDEERTFTVLGSSAELHVHGMGLTIIIRLIKRFSQEKY